MQKADDQVRVNVQLINAVTDAHLWADTYDRKLTDIFAVESEIAKTIAETLQGKTHRLGEKFDGENADGESGSLRALSQRQILLRTSGPATDLRKSIEYFKQAIAKGSQLCRSPMSALADSYGLLLSAYGATSPRESASPGRSCAEESARAGRFAS